MDIETPLEASFKAYEPTKPLSVNKVKSFFLLQPILCHVLEKGAQFFFSSILGGRFFKSQFN